MLYDFTSSSTLITNGQVITLNDNIKNYDQIQLVGTDTLYTYSNFKLENISFNYFYTTGDIATESNPGIIWNMVNFAIQGNKVTVKGNFRKYFYNNYTNILSDRTNSCMYLRYILGIPNFVI